MFEVNVLRAMAIASGLAAVLAPGASRADQVADFYSHNNIRMIISADPGGSYDSDSRLVGRHLGKHIPGNPKLILENMIGASGRLAANYMYRTAPRDGSVIATVQQSLAMGQAVGESGVNYDASRFNWIGSPVRPDEVLVVWYTTGVRTIEDAKRRQVIIGATSSTGMNYVYPKLANELLGTKFKIVTGYAGATHINLALERGEVEGRGSNPWSEWKTAKPEWVRDGKIVPLVQMTLIKHPDLPNVPRMIDLATNDDVRTVLELISITGEIGRPILTAPDVPPERVAALRKAFEEVMQDPEFLADAAQMQREIHPIPGVELEALVKKQLSAPKSAIDLLKAALAKKDR
jgi:tripartite-type tricarboxylate transporter receptor subunit TctC